MSNRLSLSFVDGNEDEHINLGNPPPAPRHPPPQSSTRFQSTEPLNFVVHRRPHHHHRDWPRGLPPEPTIKDAVVKLRSLNLHTVANNVEQASMRGHFRDSEPIHRLHRAVAKDPSLIRPTTLPPINPRGRAPPPGHPNVRYIPSGPETN